SGSRMAWRCRLLMMSLRCIRHPAVEGYAEPDPWVGHEEQDADCGVCSRITILQLGRMAINSIMLLQQSTYEAYIIRGLQMSLWSHGRPSYCSQGSIHDNVACNL